MKNSIKVITESILINRENIIEFLKNILSDQPFDEKTFETFKEKFEHLIQDRK